MAKGKAVGLEGIDSRRLFLGSCMALIATSVNFAVVGAIMGTLKTAFVLTNLQVGEIAGAATSGFTISIFVLGPLCDALGMRRLLWFAFLCHALGVLVMLFASGFWTLFFGALIISMGNGTVEAACNPLVATIYPEQKTTKLNQFHVWFPGGIVIGGLICYALTSYHIDSWQVRLCLILIPAVIYAFLFLGQKFPETERVQSGVSFGGMFKETFMRPLFLLLFFCMMITASLELGPNRWISSILEAGNIPGILVLVWISGLMAVLRFFAGPFVHKFSPTGLLLLSSILSGVGLFWLSFAESTAMAFAAATIFAFGVCYFWPTMLGVVSERVPKGGALALAMMGGIGMLIVGVVTAPWMGKIADKYLHEQLPVAETTACLHLVADGFPQLVDESKGVYLADLTPAIENARKVLATAKSLQGALPQPDTANALRAAIGAGVASPAVDEAKRILGPADNFGGRMSFREVAPFALILVVIFGILYASDRSRGGYKVESLPPR